MYNPQINICKDRETDWPVIEGLLINLGIKQAFLILLNVA